MGVLSTLGQPVLRREDARLLAGRGEFLDDLRLPDMLHMAFVRSPHAHARIVSVAAPGAAAGESGGAGARGEAADASRGAGRGAAGARRVWTAADIAGKVWPAQIVPPPGLDVAAVPHPILAHEEVRYVGQAVAAVVATSRAEAEDLAEQVEVEYEPLPVVDDPRAGETLVRWEKSAGEVAHAFAQAVHVVRSEATIPRLAAMPMEPRGVLAAPDGDRLTVYVSSQSAHRPKQQLARSLNIDEHRIRVIVPDVGGGFGSKGTLPVEAPLVAFVAQELGRPVKWAEDRRENFLAAPQGRGIMGVVELALDSHGRILAIRGRILADLGAYLLPSTPIPPHTTAMLLAGCYDVQNVEVYVTGARTHKVPTAPYRGAGRPEASYLIETAIDQAARRLKLDPVELRRRNLIRAFPYTTALGWTYDSGDFEACLDRALELIERKPGQGLGVALCVERSGGLHEFAEVTREDDQVTVKVGSIPSGQGHETLFAQIAAEKLKIDPTNVTVIHGDTDAIEDGVGTFASRSTAMGGSAVAQACDDLLEGGPGKARFESDQVFSSGAYAATVEVQRTGHVKVAQLVAVDDAGRIINPLLAEGQVVGGAVQGLGAVLTEMITGDPFAYSPLTANEIPAITTDFIESPSPYNPLGAKGIGESGVIGTPPAVANALADAIGQHLDPPFTAKKVWQALQ